MGRCIALSTRSGTLVGPGTKRKFRPDMLELQEKRVRSVRVREEKLALARRARRRNLTIDENSEPTRVGRDAGGTTNRFANGARPAVLGCGALRRARSRAHGC